MADACRIFDGPVQSVTPDEHEQRLGRRAWLDWWLAKCEPVRWLDLRALTPNRADTPWTERVRLDDLDTAVKVLMEWNKVRCVYFRVCPRRSDAPKDRRASGVVAVPGMWCDVDDASPDVVTRFRTFTKPPDHIVCSGHGYHVRRRALRCPASAGTLAPGATPAPWSRPRRGGRLARIRSRSAMRPDTALSGPWLCWSLPAGYGWVRCRG